MVQLIRLIKLFIQRRERNDLASYRLRPSAVQFPIIISQDGDSQAVMEAILSFTSEEKKISFIHVSSLLVKWDILADFRNRFHLCLSKSNLLLVIVKHMKRVTVMKLSFEL